jgi:Trypsin
MALSARALSAVTLALAAAALLPAAPAPATSGKVPDGDAHPNVGLLALQDGGDRIGWCSGFYAGPRDGAPSRGVFVTAAHCVSGLPDDAQWSVTFDSEVAMDPDTFVVTGASWVDGTGFAADDEHDIAVVVLATALAIDPVDLPGAGLLDRLADRGGLRPHTLFDNVGYGDIPSFKGAPPSYQVAPGRMLSTSLFMALNREWLKLLGNSDVGEDIGGGCYGDSGGPRLLHGTNTAVALSAGGDRICRAYGRNLRLDIPGTRSFLDQYIDIP